MTFVLPILLALPLATPASGQTCIAVREDQIFVRDATHAMPALNQLPAETSLGYAPLVGQRRTISADSLRTTARARGIELDQPNDLCFERAMADLTGEQIHDAMEDSFRELSGSWRVTAINVVRWGPQSVPQGQVVFPLINLPPRFTGSLNDEVMWRGHVSYGSVHRFPIWASVRISGTATRMVAIEPLRAGLPVEPDQIRMEECVSCAPNPRVARDPDLVIGRAPKNSIAAGSAILTNQLKPVPEVAVGDLVRVQVEVGNAHLTTEARAQMSGNTGSVIRLKNLASGNIFRATVAGKGQVSVDPEKSWIGPVRILSVRDQE